MPATDEQATLKELARDGYACAARLLDLSGKRLRLTLDGHPQPGSLVQIQGGDWSVLGEVIELQDGDPALAVIEVEHLSLNTREHERNREAWFRDRQDDGS